MEEEPLFPVLVYEYDANGFHQGGVWMSEARLQIWMRENLVKILKEKRELRITDKADMMCFHVQDGKILYDGEKHWPEGKPLPVGALD